MNIRCNLMLKHSFNNQSTHKTGLFTTLNAFLRLSGPFRFLGTSMCAVQGFTRYTRNSQQHNDVCLPVALLGGHSAGFIYHVVLLTRHFVWFIYHVVS